MLALVALLFHILGIVSSLHAVMSTRTSQGAIAWAVSLITFPYVAVPAYWVLGRNRFQGYVTARRADDEQIQDLVRRAGKSVMSSAVPVEEQSAAARAGVGLAEIPILEGNSAELLIDGEATFSSIFEGIQQARQYILVQFYIVHDDGLGRELQSRLIAKAKEGVRVYFLYDEVGSHKLPTGYQEKLRAAGVQLYDFHSRKGPWNRFQINFRNHRKIVVVDGKAAWIGGHNVGDEYLGKDPKMGAWRDTHVKIEGPAVMAVQLSFVEDWHWATDEAPEVSWQPRPADDGDINVL